VPHRDVVYFVPQNLNARQKAWLDDRGIACIEPADTYAVLPPETRFAAIGRAIAGFIAALSRPAAIAPLLARLIARAPYWDALFTELGITTYVTTTSYSWPEKPELAVAAARGIRSIIWAYSANSLTFTVEDPRFRDLGVARSIVIAGEFWVWNRAYAEWLEKRRVETPGPPCKVRVVGPLMCGNAAWLGAQAAAARSRLGLPREGLCIGAFDMPPITDAWRDRFGGGPPMVDTETYIEFWKVIERVAKRIPGCYVLVKLKRDFTHAYREFPDFLRALLDEHGEHVRAGLVRRVDVNVDPYLPIAACDIAIGIAYTSPVLAARTAGRPGYYLDPLKRAYFPSHTDFSRITLHTEDELVDAVLRARRDCPAMLEPAEAVTPPPPTVPLHA
jgi:polysaccharide biosynthesis PFTS motif protein